MVNSNDTTDNIEPDGKFIYWLIFSLISALILSRFAKGMCAYLFTSLAWIYLWMLFTQSWSTMERRPQEVGLIAVASLIGWAIGTFLVWKKKDWRTGFFDD